jgi:hypothetical protein
LKKEQAEDEWIDQLFLWLWWPNRKQTSIAI